MDPALLFSLAFPLAAPFWAVMIFVPGWSWTRRIIGSPLIVLPPVLIYALAVLPELTTFLTPRTPVSAPIEAGYSTVTLLARLRGLSTSRPSATAAW